VNHHEGDWERIQVIGAGPRRLTDAQAFRAVGFQYFFHDFWMEPTRLVWLAGEAGEDHPLVHVGGDGRFLAWSGPFSGGSFPLPARYA
jgi:hypothetical protein